MRFYDENPKPQKRYSNSKQFFMFISFIAIGSTFLMWTVYWQPPTQSIGLKIRKAHQCYKTQVMKDIDESLLNPNILESQKQPTLGESIFFLETGCHPRGFVNISARTACSIESAALANPEIDVFLLIVAPFIYKNITLQTNMHNLLSYPNIYIRTVDLWQYTKDTPVEDWLNTDTIFTSDFLTSHLSDFMRFITLYRYGGTYMDTDIIVRKSIDSLESNFATTESKIWKTLGAGSAVLNFHHSGIGRIVAEKCLIEYATNFKPYEWDWNGPGVITRVLTSLCRTEDMGAMHRSQCQEFQVFNQTLFSSIQWFEYKIFFANRYKELVMKRLQNSIGVHFWNNLSRKIAIRKGSNSAIDVLARQHCPLTYVSQHKEF